MFNREKYIDIIKTKLNDEYGMLSQITTSQWDEIINDYNGLFFVLLDDQLIKSIFDNNPELKRKINKMKLYGKYDVSTGSERDMLNELSPRIRYSDE